MRKVSNGTIQQIDKEKPRNKCRRWRLCFHVDGKRVSKRFTGSVSDARRALALWRAELAEGAVSGGTFKEYAGQWLELRRESGRYSPATLANDAGAVKALCSSPLGDMKLGEITLDDCERALLWVRDHPARGKRLSGSSLRAIYVKLREIFKRAELSERIAKDPTRHPSDRSPGLNKDFELFSNSHCYRYVPMLY